MFIRRVYALTALDIYTFLSLRSLSLNCLDVYEQRSIIIVLARLLELMRERVKTKVKISTRSPFSIKST